MASQQILAPTGKWLTPKGKQRSADSNMSVIDETNALGKISKRTVIVEKPINQ